MFLITDAGIAFIAGLAMLRDLTMYDCPRVTKEGRQRVPCLRSAFTQ